MNTSIRLARAVGCLTFAAATSLFAANYPANSPSTVPSTNRGTPTTQTSTTSDQPVKDSWITTKVKSELATTKDIKSMDISVKTLNGTVELSGTQPNEMAVKKAISVAQGVKGVVRVDASGLKSESSTPTHQ